MVRTKVCLASRKGGGAQETISTLGRSFVGVAYFAGFDFFKLFRFMFVLAICLCSFLLLYMKNILFSTKLCYLSCLFFLWCVNVLVVYA